MPAGERGAIIEGERGARKRAGGGAERCRRMLKEAGTETGGPHAEAVLRRRTPARWRRTSRWRRPAPRTRRCGSISAPTTSASPSIWRSIRRAGCRRWSPIEGILTETPAILAFIAQSFPKAQLAPLDDAVRVRARAGLQQLSLLHRPRRPRAPHARYRWADDAAAIEAMKRKVPQTVGECFELIEREMFDGPWVMGDDLHDLRSVSLHGGAVAGGRRRGHRPLPEDPRPPQAHGRAPGREEGAGGGAQRVVLVHSQPVLASSTMPRTATIEANFSAMNSSQRALLKRHAR